MPCDGILHAHQEARAKAIEVNPAHTSQLLSYKDEFVFTDCSIREYWDEELNLLIDRDINSSLNIKRVGLDVFPTLSAIRFSQTSTEED